MYSIIVGCLISSLTLMLVLTSLKENKTRLINKIFFVILLTVLSSITDIFLNGKIIYFVNFIIIILISFLLLFDLHFIISISYPFMLSLSHLLSIFSSNSILMNNILYSLNITIIFIIIIIQKKSFNHKYNNALDKIYEYENIIDEQGKKNHEYNNQLMIIKGYIDNKKKLKEYLELIIDDHRTGQNYRIRQLSNFPKGGLKNLLYEKLSLIKDKGLKSFLYIEQDINSAIEKLALNTYKDLSLVFGVFIDNAIDASIDSDKKEVGIDIKTDDNYLIIQIDNTFDKSEDIDKVGNKGYSTKGKGHGYGLSIVKDIKKNNNKIETLTEIKGDLFKQTVLVDLR